MKPSLGGISSGNMTLYAGLPDALGHRHYSRPQFHHHAVLLGIFYGSVPVVNADVDWGIDVTRPGEDVGWLKIALKRLLHAKNKFAGRCIPFLVLGFWDKNTGICAGAMPYRRDFPATTGI